MKQEFAHRDGNQNIEHADGKIGNEFAEDEFAGFDGSGNKLLHRAAFPFAGDGKRCEHRGDDHHDDGDKAGDDEVFAFQIGIEPDPRTHIERRSEI